MSDRRATALQDLFTRYDRDPRTGEVLFSVRSGDGSLDVTFGDPARPIFLMGATQLVVAAILARQRARGLVDWDAPMAGYLPDIDLTGLHARRGKDRTGAITIRHLLSHTSGLPDYLDEPRGASKRDFRSTFTRIAGQDQTWDHAQALAWSREIPPRFAPGGGRRAFVSSTNTRLLGAVAERTAQASFAEVVRREVSDPLGLTGTWVFGPDDLDGYDRIAPMVHSKRRLRIPQAIGSLDGDGGAVSTLADLQILLRATFDGEYVPAPIFTEMTSVWRRSVFPLRAGTGLMRFQLPAAYTGFRRIPPMIGVSGQNGTVAYACPELDLWIVGTVGQTMFRSLPYKLLVQIALAARG
jgi:D-alanyl-D-alanine carboxypeptidase